MTGRLVQIWRYPLKSIGRERLDRVRLNRGEKLAWDRHWAIIHGDAEDRVEEPGHLAGWLPKSSFLRGAACAELQAISGGMENGTLVLSHPRAGEISVDPASDADEARLIAWLRPLWPAEQPAPAQLVSCDDALTDSPKPYISINSLDSLHAVESLVGKRLGTERWRGNLWIEGFAPFSERDWIGREIQIGPARLIIRTAIGRCAATSADTATGMADLDMVRTLTDAYGQASFGVYAEVISGGEVAELNEVIPGEAPSETTT